MPLQELGPELKEQNAQSHQDDYENYNAARGGGGRSAVSEEALVMMSRTLMPLTILQLLLNVDQNTYTNILEFEIELEKFPMYSI